MKGRKKSSNQEKALWKKVLGAVLYSICKKKKKKKSNQMFVECMKKKKKNQNKQKSLLCLEIK